MSNWMIHYIFWWQVAAIAMGVSLIALVVSSLRPGIPSRKLRLEVYLGLSVLFMLARNIVFAAYNYDLGTGLGIFPFKFENRPESALLYLLLVSLSTWFLLAILLELSRRRRFLPVIIAYWTCPCLSLAAYAMVFLQSEVPYVLAPFALRSTAAWPLVYIKVFIVEVAVAALIAAFRERTAGRLTWALSFVALSQLADIASYLGDDLFIALVPLHFLGYYTALFLIAGLIMEKSPSAIYQDTTEQSALSAELSASLSPNPSTGLSPGLFAEVGQAERLTMGTGLCMEERELLGLILSGKANKEIAWQLGLSLSAEKHRVQKLFRKLGVVTRSELFARASEKLPGQIPVSPRLPN